MSNNNEAVMRYLREVSRDLPLFSSGEAPIAIPSNFLMVSRDTLLQNKALLMSLMSCYRDVFGRGDFWGEGFVCKSCSKTFPIEHSSPRCVCGGELTDYHSEAEIIKRLVDELEPPSFCTLMLSPTNNAEVAGFCWGFIGDADKLSYRIASNKHVCGYESAVKDALGSRGRILYFDEMGIRRSNRIGVPPLIFLSRVAYGKANEEGISSALFWTARKSPMYKICRSFGYEDILETDDGIVFLLIEDFRPALKVMQNKSSLESARILAQLAQL